MKELDKKYDPSQVEDRLYAFWCEHKLFTPVPTRIKNRFR